MLFQLGYQNQKWKLKNERINTTCEWRNYPSPPKLGSEFPWSEKSTTPPTRPCKILPWRALSRALSASSSTRWFRGMARSRGRKLPGKSPYTTVAGSTTTVTVVRVNNNRETQSRIVVSSIATVTQLVLLFMLQVSRETLEFQVNRFGLLLLFFSYLIIM